MNNLREITIAIDAMVGDLGPTAVVNGVFLATKKNSKIFIMLIHTIIK